MEIALMLTRRCNASCAHCSTACGPRRSETLPPETIFRLMDEAAALAKNQSLSFLLTGGEPFLDFGSLLTVVRHAKALGAGVSCVTNGYWATSPETASSKLTLLQESGLSALAVSASRFHLQFVKRRRVERVLGACREIGLTCTLKYARTAADPEDETAIRTWATTAGAHAVQDFSVLPYREGGAELSENDYPRERGLPEGPCPAAIFTVREDGEAFTCCAPGALTDLLSLGKVRDRPLAEIFGRYYLGGAQQLLREHGPIHFARAAIARGEGHRLRDSYASICDLCAHIGSDSALAAVAATCAAEVEERHAGTFLQTLLRSH